jgi:hypothetical protein
LLVDTYDTERRIRRAIEVLRGLPPDRRIGIRLDSGDLGALAVPARRLLDGAGLQRADIVTGGGLDEYAIADMVAAGADRRVRCRHQGRHRRRRSVPGHRVEPCRLRRTPGHESCRPAR